MQTSPLLHAQKTVQPMVLHLQWPSSQPDAHPHRIISKTATGADRAPLAQSWASSRIRRAPNHASGNRFWGTVPSIDAFQCVACRWARFTFSVNVLVVGGRLHNFKAAPIWVFFLHILIRASLMLAHLLKPLPYQLHQYEWRSLLEYNSFICLCICNSM